LCDECEDGTEDQGQREVCYRRGRPPKEVGETEREPVCRIVSPSRNDHIADGLLVDIEKWEKKAANVMKSDN
jgi:hypothetical protein